MTNVKHTPGPWQVADEHTGMNGKRTGAAVVQFSKGDGWETTTRIANVSRRRDAALIAAAPELLAALRELLDDLSLDERHPNHPAVDAAYEAIAKAEGA